MLHQEMDFQRRLLDVGKSLSADELKALRFLCTDLLGRNLTSVDPNEIFSRLQEQDHLSEERPHLLTELLVTIRRIRLVSELNLSHPQPEAGDLISPFRKLLYDLSEEITDDGFRQMKFLLRNTLPRRALDDHVTILDVFLEMEHMDHLSDTNLDQLETIIQSVCPVLNEKIRDFKAQQAYRSPIARESEESVFTSFPANQGSLTSSWQRQEVLPSSRRVRSTVGTDAQRTSSIEEEEVSNPIQSKSTKTLGLQSYPMTAAKRGICLIINNYDFAGTLLKREGTKLDERALVDVFEWLGFETCVHNDCTSVQMMALLRELGSRDHSHMDSVVCCILTHGMEGTVLGVDGLPVHLADLRELLNGSRCASLANKPKLFFIQACQGNDSQRHVWLETDNATESSVCSDAVAMMSIPADADFLFAMSTVPSYVSYRDKRTGSWFIQSLCQNLIQMVPSGSDLVSILTQVNADVSQKKDISGQKKQMPQPNFTLRKKVIFPPPKAAPPRLSSV